MIKFYLNLRNKLTFKFGKMRKTPCINKSKLDVFLFPIETLEGLTEYLHFGAKHLYKDWRIFSDSKKEKTTIFFSIGYLP